jgi:hypothetical protein
MTGNPAAKALLLVVLILSLGAAARADVVRPAPGFNLDGVAKPMSLRGFRGQAVVLVFTRTARDGDFRRQVARLRALYSQFATEKVIFVAAIEQGPADVPSDIPFAIAANGPQVAADYGVTGRFAIAVIGVDGNLDLITNKVIAAERVRDTVFNNFESQQESRKQPNF